VTVDVYHEYGTRVGGGRKGKNLRKFIKEQQALEREDRSKEREAREKEKEYERQEKGKD